MGESRGLRNNKKFGDTSNFGRGRSDSDNWHKNSDDTSTGKEKVCPPILKDARTGENHGVDVSKQLCLDVLSKQKNKEKEGAEDLGQPLHGEGSNISLCLEEKAMAMQVENNNSNGMSGGGSVDAKTDEIICTPNSETKGKSGKFHRYTNQSRKGNSIALGKEGSEVNAGEKKRALEGDVDMEDGSEKKKAKQGVVVDGVMQNVYAGLPGQLRETQ
jgi:hypothetical protein